MPSVVEGPLLARFLGLVTVATVATALAIALIVPARSSSPAPGSTRAPHAAENFRELAQRSVIYDCRRQHDRPARLQDRQYVALDQVPKLLQDAVVAVEDQSFWDNPGIDVNGITPRRARRTSAPGEVEQGGSTITQQLVKNRVLTPKRTSSRKVREIVLAVELAERYPKREILEQYLNTVYFGQGAYGVQAAVERFFLQTGHLRARRADAPRRAHRRVSPPCSPG